MLLLGANEVLIFSSWPIFLPAFLEEKTTAGKSTWHTLFVQIELVVNDNFLCKFCIHTKR